MAELSDEDQRLLADWLAGPGARPTEADRRRWLQQAREDIRLGRVVRRVRPGDDA